MKSLSAHHFREARAALEPSRAYGEGVERVVAKTGAWLPAGDGLAGLLVIGAELGLCGSYNARVAEHAIACRAAIGPGPTLCVGRRAAGALRRRGLSPDAVYAGPASLHGLEGPLLRIAQDMIERTLVDRLARFDVVSARFEGVGADRPHVTELLPVEIAPSDGAPTRRYVSVERMEAVGLRELLYVRIHQLLLEALASEHGARLVATQAAERWLDDRREGVRRQLASARREASTEEVVEISAGARAHARS
jgi:F-type H+-transporting ATPase subunit gamma